MVKDNRDDWFAAIASDIIIRVERGQPTLVFFKSVGDLIGFHTSEAGRPLRANTLHGGNMAASEHTILAATKPGSVTLFVEMPGCDFDFDCDDFDVASNGGVHVIQTYLAESRCEEVRIQGCTRRQGDPGTYKNILFAHHLLHWNETTDALVSRKDLDKHAHVGPVELLAFLAECRLKWQQRLAALRNSL